MGSSQKLIAVPDKSLGLINDERRISTGRKSMENHTQLEIMSGCGRRKSASRGSTLIRGKDRMLYWREYLKRTTRWQRSQLLTKSSSCTSIC